MTKEKLVLSSACMVLDKEIEGLIALKKSLGREFEKVVDTILNIKGRVIISGMGKSGHVANKIASTFSSTGTPAVFVHPGEAVHGDLGMITEDDIVLILSNSGETLELKGIVHYAKRFSIKLISIVSQKSSTLAEASYISLIIPDMPEACSDIKAPTTSTTVMMALGDAIAVALLKLRGFSRDDFSIFHPGGKLGAELLKVGNLMHYKEQLPICNYNDSIFKTVEIMNEKGFGCIAVVDNEGFFVGVITDGDLRRGIIAAKHFSSGIASDFMTRNPISISVDSFIIDAIKIMQEFSVTGLFILENKKPVGILNIHDILTSGII